MLPTHGFNSSSIELNITKYSELGDNKSIKNPPPMESSRSAKKRTKCVSPFSFSPFNSCHTNLINQMLLCLIRLSVNSTTDNAIPSSPSHIPPAVPRYYSQLKKAHKVRQIPELREEDLEESFVRGSGPGGQSVNKTENNVQLLHKPTGIRVACQETRSLADNRRIARKILTDKVCTEKILPDDR